MTDEHEFHGLSPVLISAIRQIPRSDQYYIGLSGGLDSLALVYLCAPYLRQFTSDIKVIHVHHGLSERADDWAAFCQEICSRAGLDIVVEPVQVQSQGNGLEAAARKARYQVFARYLSRGGILLQGHHLNDQAETLLMRFIKGLGPSALRGIPSQRYLSGGLIYRPWLGVTREQLKSAMTQFASEWVEDESNLDQRFERNFIRHSILPLLEERRPTVLQDLRHTAERSEEYVEFISQWCLQHASQFMSVEYIKERALDLHGLKTFNTLQQKFILRYWFDVLGVDQPGEQNFKRLISDLVQSDSVSRAEVVWKQYCVRSFNGALFCLYVNDLSTQPYRHELCLSELVLKSKGQSEIVLPQGVLTVSIAGDEDEPPSPSDVNSYCYSVACNVPGHIKRLIIRSRSPGDKIRLNPEYLQTLKKIYQSRRILPWHRDHLPVIELIFDGGRINDLSSTFNASLCGVADISCRSGGEKEALDYHVVHFNYATVNGLREHHNV